jgi:hypothetical protein
MNVPNFPHPDAPLLRAIRGPVLVVVTGILFLIDHAGGSRFGNTWPVLLIVLGMLRLAEYWGAKKA